MVFAPKTLAVLPFLISCAINRVECTVILMRVAGEKALMHLVNDLNAPVTVEGPGVALTGVPQGSRGNLRFSGPGKVTVTEGDEIIFTTDLSNGNYNTVRTHSNANLSHVFGPITISQKADRLNLVMSGGNGKHDLALSEARSTPTQSISFDGNTIAITQASTQKSQNLAFSGKADNISWTQDSAPVSQSIAVNGRGSHGTYISKSNGITMITQTSRIPTRAF